MKLTTHRMVGWQISCLRGLVVVLGLIAATAIWAQESKPVGDVAQASTEAKLPDAIQALTPAIVTVTRVEPAVGDPAQKPVSHAGVVVDPRGYIVIPLLPSPSKLTLFTVRLSDQKEVVGQLAAVDESLKFGVLKIERPEPVPAVSLAKSREARVDDSVRLVPSPASKELRGGRVTSTTITLGEEGSTKLIQTDVTFPLSEFGSLMVSESGELLGIFMAARTTPKPESIVLPLKAVLPLITAAIDKPKDVPVVTVPASSPVVDLGKPVQIGLQPATRIAKLLVEQFTPRGAKILVYKEGQQLKIEAPPLVLEELSQLLAAVSREPQKPEAKAATPTDAPMESPKPNVAEQVVDPKMPDITGTWQVAIWYQEKGKYEPVEAGEMEIRRVGATSFLIDQPWVEKATRIFVLWSAPNRRFQGVWGDDDGGHSKITLQPATDINTLRVIVTKRQSAKEPPKDVGTEETPFEKSAISQWPQEWRRTSLTLSTSRLEKDLELPEVVSDQVSVGKTTEVVANARAVPNTPAAKQLVEQLAAQESAAAAEAATIRQLQANGQAESNQQPIAEHQRKLKHLLSTAFDLKLQLEELQVKELQSRLSRLERQIGQRKELREKIINRRAGELIEGDALRWDSTAFASRNPSGPTVVDTTNVAAKPRVGESSSTAAAPPLKPDLITIDLYAGSLVLPGLGKNPGYSKLLQSLNALKGVTTNIREAGQGNVILMAIVRDPSQRCQREARQTQKESELRIAINSALKAAGIEATRWDESAAAEGASAEEPAAAKIKPASANVAEGKTR